jgi:hypothetical protein
MANNIIDSNAMANIPVADDSQIVNTIASVNTNGKQYKTPAYVRKCQKRFYENHVEDIKILNKKYYDEKIRTDPEAYQRWRESIKKSVDKKKEDPVAWELVKQKRREYAREYRARKKLEADAIASQQSINTISAGN